MSVVIVIPARYASARFPGKPLIRLKGTTLIERCYRSAVDVPGVHQVVVATDDKRILDHVEAFGGVAVMTPESCVNGTERCAAALPLLTERPEILVNWQGDSPLIHQEYVTALVEGLRRHPHAELVTPVISCDSELFERLRADRRAGRVGGTMAVLSRHRKALYFSKELIPFADKASVQDVPYYYHVGMYAYRPQVLEAYPTWPVGPLEKIEGLEQLRFLENDRYVAGIVVEGKGHWEVNNPEDVAVVESFL
jgi:3-deoxy-manno-octulosonate cytidylyltransferase (CMP-KDO synthetase)